MTEPFFAYIDPGAGATLAQLALAGTAGLAAIGKLRLTKMKNRLSRKVDTEVESRAGAQADDPATTE
jgi:hypothetical protein